MWVTFFLHLKKHRLPVSLTELMDLVSATPLLEASVGSFYQMARLTLIKDERLYDRFDRAFRDFTVMEKSLQALNKQTIPKHWLEKMVERYLSENEKQQVKSLGGLDELIKTFNQRLNTQKERHQGGNKWIGTAGSSPFGADGYNPEGIRIGQVHSRHYRALKVWEKREYKNLDDEALLCERNMMVALKRLKNVSKTYGQGAFDLHSTVEKTAKNAGFLDLCYKPKVHNDINVIILYDVGGSMDCHIELCQKLFVAARMNFKSLVQLYFHNCPYESLWANNDRRSDSKVATNDFLNKYNSTHKLILVGDATMSPYEIMLPGGSVAHMNKETGEVWLKRIVNHFPNLVWLNPVRKTYWSAQSVDMIGKIIGKRMYPLTIGGIHQGINTLLTS